MRPAEGGWTRIQGTAGGGGATPRGLAAGLLALAVIALAAGASADKGAPTAPEAGAHGPLSVDLAPVQEIYPNGSVTGALGAGAPRYFKVFANRSLAAPETLAVTIEATGSLFGEGSLSVYDPEQVLLDERFTNNPGDIQVSLFIVPETGYYLLIVASDTSYSWAVTVNWTSGGAAPPDGDNDHANATLLTGAGGTASDSVADWDDLVDLYAIDLSTNPPRAEALMVNLTSPNTADLDLYIYHIVGGVAEIDGLSISPIGIEYAAALPPISGRYYIRVMSYARSSTYDLEWSRFNVTADYNQDPASALPLPPGQSQNNLSRWDMRDLFTFTLPANTTINVSLHTEGYNASNGQPDLQVILWDANFTRISWSFVFDPDERINAVVPASGAYYLDIYAQSIAYYLSTSLTFGYTMAVSIDRPPTLIRPDWNSTGNEDTAQVVDLFGAIPRDPANETMTYTVVATTGPVSATLGADGHTLTVVPAADAFGAATVTVAAEDRWQRVPFALPFAVVPVNDPPRGLFDPTTLQLDEDALGELIFANAFFDPEGNSWILLAVGSSPLFTFTLPVSGDRLQVQAVADFAGTGSFNVTLQDEFGASQNITVFVNVRPVNDAPRFSSSPGPLVLDEDASGGAATFDLAGIAFDPDGDAVSFTLLGAPQLSALFVGARLTLVPSADFNGEVSATLQASDGTATASVPLLLRVLPVNDAPRLNAPPGPLLGTEGARFTFEASASDLDTPPANFTYSFALDSGSAQPLAASAVFAHTFDFESAGYHVLHVTVSDGALSAAADYTVFVAGANRAPEALILTPRSTSFPGGAVVSFASRATDPDGDAVNVTWVVDGTAVSADPAFSMERLPPGPHTVELLVFDGEFTSSDTAHFEVVGSFIPGPDAPLALLALALVAASAAVLRRRPPGASINAPKSLK